MAGQQGHIQGYLSFLPFLSSSFVFFQSFSGSREQSRRSRNEHLPRDVAPSQGCCSFPFWTSECQTAEDSLEAEILLAQILEWEDETEGQSSLCCKPVLELS